MAASAESNDKLVALVTGGARGIGLAISRLLHERGMCVVVADSGVSVAGDEADPKVAEDAAESIGPNTIAFTDDLSDPHAATAAVELARTRFGSIDVVVNAAAVLRDAFIFKGKPENWDFVLKNNLSSAFYVLAAATPHLREQVKAGRAPGRIINITSSAGVYGNFGQSAYASAKAGLIGLTRVVAMDMARSGVTCNAVLPFAATRVTDLIQPANDIQAQYKERALKVPPRFVAELVGFLCSPRAQLVTGQLLGVRGRELFLFSQARPTERLIAPEDDWDDGGFSTAFQTEFASKLTSLTTDLETFNTEPII